jgi:hypothetical protein
MAAVPSAAAAAAAAEEKGSLQPPPPPPPAAAAAAAAAGPPADMGGVWRELQRFQEVLAGERAAWGAERQVRGCVC